MSSGAPLEIHVHLVDCSVVVFVEEDAEAARKLLAQIQPGRLFAQGQLVFAGRNSMTAFPTGAVTRVDLVGADVPAWHLHERVISIQQITEAEFRERYHPGEDGAARLDSQRIAGEVVVAYHKIALVNGERLYSEVTLVAQPATPIDRTMLIRRLFSAPVLISRRREGGVILINPANMVSIRFFPGPPETPPNAWAAHCISE